jgi:hypothetical protein
MPNPISRPRGVSAPPYGARLGDMLAANVGLHAWCCTCGRLREIDTRALARRHGDLAQLRDLEPRLRCSDEHCQSKGGVFYVRDGELARIAAYR